MVLAESKKGAWKVNPLYRSFPVNTIHAGVLKVTFRYPALSHSLAGGSLCRSGHRKAEECWTCPCGIELAKCLRPGLPELW